MEHDFPTTEAEQSRLDKKREIFSQEDSATFRSVSQILFQIFCHLLAWNVRPEQDRRIAVVSMPQSNVQH
jgi:hypothetical protein